MRFEIKNRWTGNVQHTCKLSAEIAGKSYAVQLGFAVQNAVEADADLRGADLSGAAWLPRIENIHRTVYAAANNPGALDMRSWHGEGGYCGTTHCRAGWVVHLAGPGGRALEGVYGTPAAAALIYQASDPKLERIPDFYCDNDTALADMKRLADLEASREASA